MQKIFLRLVLLGVLLVSSVFAAEGDLLSKTMNRVVMPIKSDMIVLIPYDTNKINNKAIYNKIDNIYYNVNTKMISFPYNNKRQYLCYTQALYENL